VSDSIQHSCGDSRPRLSVERSSTFWQFRTGNQLTHVPYLCRRSKIRQMRSPAPKDAASQHKSGGQGLYPPSRLNQREEKGNPLPATTCMGKRADAFARLHPPIATRSFLTDSRRLPSHPDGTTIARIQSSHAHSCVLPRLRRTLFRNPNRSTGSVPKRILLLQTADVSIHLRAIALDPSGDSPLRPGHLPYAVRVFP
jgi:hypothetical protein